MSDSHADSGLSLTDAAAQLGISERTVLRRIKDGSIVGRKIGEGHGGVWRIYLDALSDSQTVTTSDSQTSSPSILSDSQTQAAATQSDSQTRVSDSMSDSQTQPVAEVLKALEMIDRLQQQNQELWKTLEHWQARAVEAEQTVKLLMAPKDEPEPEQPAQPKRPWWRKLLGDR